MFDPYLDRRMGPERPGRDAGLRRRNVHSCDRALSLPDVGLGSVPRLGQPFEGTRECRWRPGQFGRRDVGYALAPAERYRGTELSVPLQ